VDAKKADAPAGIHFVYRGEGLHWWQRAMWVVGRVILWLLTLILFRLRTRGMENVPKKGGVLLVTNHQSFLDPPLIGIALRRQIHYMARETLFKGGFLQWLAETLNTFPVKRGQADLAAVRMAVERLDKGFVVNIFPEGTRTEDGSIGTIAPGVALIVGRCKTPVSIVPVVIDGAFEAWPRTQRLPHPGRIRIVYGKPILPEEFKGLKGAELAARIREAMVGMQRAMGSAHSEKSERMSG